MMCGLSLSNPKESEMGKYWVDVTIHIDENLEDKAIHDLEYDLFQLEGVYSACVNEKTRHLMVVDFDPVDMACGDLLWHVERHGLHAELIGL